MEEIENPYENPYDEDENYNEDCDCYGCATMRHECWYDYIERKRRERNVTQDTTNKR